MTSLIKGRATAGNLAQMVEGLAAIPPNPNASAASTVRGARGSGALQPWTARSLRLPIL